MKKTATLFLFICFIAAQAQGPWSQKASMGGLQRHRPFTFTIGMRGYLGCGWNGVTMYGDFWEYDPGTNTWQQKADYPAGPRLSAFGFSIGNKGYAGTGLDDFLVAQPDFYEYDPLTNAWTSKAPFTATPVFAASATVVGTKAYICFGDDWNYFYLRYNNLWEYNPSTDAWTALSPCPGNPRRDAVAFTIGSKAYFGTGNDESYTERFDFWEYEPSTGAWTQMADFMGSARSQAVGFAVNGKGYIGTGGQLDEQDFFEYDPLLNSWRGIDLFPGAGRENSASFVIGNLAYVTCGTSGINYNDLWEFNSAYITGVEENSNITSISIFPNPMVEQASVELNKTYNDATWHLVTMEGKEVYSEKMTSSKFQVNKNNLSSGTYLLKIQSGTKIVSTKKIIIK